MDNFTYETPFFILESLFDIAAVADKELKAWLSAGCCDPTAGEPV